MHDCLHHGRAVISSVHDLFEQKEEIEAADSAAPLATRMRPRALEEFVGQEHILGPGKLLRRAIEADRLPSVILSGPAGTGKTTLAHIIAKSMGANIKNTSGPTIGTGTLPGSPINVPLLGATHMTCQPSLNPLITKK